MNANTPGLFAEAVRRPVLSVAVALACAGCAGMAGLFLARAGGGIEPVAGLTLGRLPAMPDDAAPPALLTFAALAMPVLELALFAALAWTLVRGPVRLRLIRLRGDHLVIVGQGALARIAATHELDRGGAVLLWRVDDDVARRGPDWVGPALRRGAVQVRRGDPARTVAELGLAKARSVLLLCDGAQDNVDLAEQVLREAARVRFAGDPLAVIAQIDDRAMQARLDAEADVISKAIVRLRFASMAGLAARKLFLDWPLDCFRRAGETERRIIAFGFSPMIESYVLRVLAGNHFRDGVRPDILIAAPAAAAAAEQFRSRHAGADALSPIVFETIDFAQASRAVADLVARYGDPVAVLVDTGDPAVSRAVAEAVDRHYRAQDRATPLVHLCVDADDTPPAAAMIHAFGGLEEFTEPDLLTQEQHDALARSIHDFYLEGRLAEGDRIGARGSMKEWDDLAESFRDDNRLVADCYKLKLRDIGARIVPDRGPPLRLEPDELEDMARAEHDRWMAAKISDGWIHGPQRDDRLRLHPDIVPYDALPERVKDLDREQVRVMTRLLAAGNERTLRILTLAIEPGVRGEIAAGLPGLLATIATQWPDRVVVIAGSLGHAAARKAMATAGERVRLVVPGHAGRLIEGLDAAEQAIARGVLARADSIVGVATPANVREAVLAGADLVILDETADNVPYPTVRISAKGLIRTAPWLG